MMTGKDLKDMTASELLREADSNPCSMCHLVMTGDESCATTGCASWAYRLADKIDAELAYVRKEAVRKAKKPMWWFRAAISRGEDFPAPQDGETFRHYLDRCFIPRPRFEDGEPVQLGDKAEHPYTGETCTIDCINTFNGSYCLGFVEERSASLCDGERVKRPAPEVLGADGKPLNEDDTAYGTGREQHRYTVQVPFSINDEVGDRFCVQCYDHDEGNVVWCDPSMLTHTPTDTQERIDDDATMAPADYCAVRGVDLVDDPDREAATTAMTLDLLRRQRELDARKGGAE